MPRKWQTSSASGSFAVPLKILNFSSTRGRGLRSVLSSVTGGLFFSTFSIFSGGVTKVAMIVSGLLAFSCYRSLAVQPSAIFAGSRVLTADFLAGPLGFEPRQSAPKALDLPLVDGPVISACITRGRKILRSAQDFGCGLPLYLRPQKRLNLP